MSASNPQPVARGERVPLFDVLRGFALLGILLVNFWGSVGTSMPRVDGFVNEALVVLVSSSFYPLYSFLFGLGFAVLLASAQSRGRRVGHLYLRRLIVLFLIGTIHTVFIWDGDILVHYAIAGVLLIPLHRLPQKAVLAVVLVMFVAQMNRQTVNSWRAPPEASADAALMEVARSEGDALVANRRLLAQEEAGESSLSAYQLSVSVRWNTFATRVRGWFDWWAYLLDDVLLYFMVGLLVGRARVLHEVVKRRRVFLLISGLGLAAAVTGLVAQYTLGLPLGLWSNLSFRAADVGLTVFYVAGIALLYTFSARGRGILDVFAAPGRIGLTNYLMQSVVMTLLMEDYAFGWRPSTTVWVLINLAFFFGVQVPFSRWWTSRYQFGPAEWLWRTLTYGQVQPMRLQVPAFVATPVPAAAG